VKGHCKRVECADGAHVSVQASQYHYCAPRNDSGPYTHIEAGFPSAVPPASWMEFCEDADRPTDTVYGYMPVSCVWEFIDAHGGMVGGELPSGCER
jgi:hypothetical protein